MTAISDIRRIIAAHHPRLLSESDKTHAAVALVFHEHAAGLRLLFIERAEREEDPWSGHIAFPGGKVEACDREPRASAERETLEEIGIDLGKADYLGRLDDLSGSTLPVQVSGFAYLLAPAAPKVASHLESLDATLTLNTEVRTAFWFNLTDLVDPQCHLRSRFSIGGREVLLPAIQMGKGKPLLWGLTYRFVMQVIEGLGIEIAGATS